MPLKMKEEEKDGVYPGRLRRSNVKQRRTVVHIKEKNLFFFSALINMGVGKALINIFKFKIRVCQLKSRSGVQVVRKILV